MLRKRFCRERTELFDFGEWRLHQVNAPYRKSTLVTQYLEDMGINTVPHSPLSPDLAPCYFWMFPIPKKKLKRHRFEDLCKIKVG